MGQVQTCPRRKISPTRLPLPPVFGSVLHVLGQRTIPNSPGHVWSQELRLGGTALAQHSVNILISLWTQEGACSQLIHPSVETFYLPFVYAFPDVSHDPLEK